MEVLCRKIGATKGADGLSDQQNELIDSNFNRMCSYLAQIKTANNEQRAARERLWGLGAMWPKSSAYTIEQGIGMKRERQNGYHALPNPTHPFCSLYRERRDLNTTCLAW